MLTPFSATLAAFIEVTSTPLQDTAGQTEPGIPNVTSATYDQDRILLPGQQAVHIVCKSTYVSSVPSALPGTAMARCDATPKLFERGKTGIPSMRLFPPVKRKSRSTIVLSLGRGEEAATSKPEGF